MTTTPTAEPTAVIAGDTITWQKTLSDYPASAGWVLKYRLVNALGKIDITAAASGDDHLVSITAATSATWVAGNYDYVGWVEKGAERYSVVAGRIKVQPNIATLTTYDGRSQVRQAVEALESAMLDYAKNGQGHIAEYEILGRRTRFRNMTEIENLLQFYRSELRKEEQAARLAAGKKPGNRLLVRFK